jgi:Domain of unknown function (DUF4406)
MRVYISGPVAGKPDRNREAFAAEAKRLRELGHQPVNPLDLSADHEGRCIGPDTGFPFDLHQYGCYLRADLLALLECDAIARLDGWARSKGAMTEVHVAQSLGMPVL